MILRLIPFMLVGALAGCVQPSPLTFEGRLPMDGNLVYSR